MKKLNIIYWSITIPFVAFMLSNAIPNMLATPDWVNVFKYLGYPEYMIPFIGIAKVLGIIGILIPGFPRIKEWAYAGLAFDLIGATYSILAVGGTENAGWLFMPVLLLFLFSSYILYHKRLKLRASRNEQTVFGTPVTLG